MEGQEYLNQISASNRPVSKPSKGLFSSKFFIIGIVFVVVLVIIIIFGMLLSSNKGGEKNLAYALNLHVSNTADVMQDYQSKVKSSDLRSSSASLYAVLTNTGRDLNNYITEKYGKKDKDFDKTLTENASMAKDELTNDLFEAKINGNLDRIYAHKMAYEISLIATEETKLISTTSNTELKEFLTESYNSLENLYEKFNNYSETK